MAGASLPIETALLMGFSNLIADGISMGLGDFLSSKAEHEYEASESKREQWEFDANKADEVSEQVELFKKAGVTDAHAHLLAETLACYPAVFHAVHLHDELGITPPDADASPGIDGLVGARRASKLQHTVPLALSRRHALCPLPHPPPPTRRPPPPPPFPPPSPIPTPHPTGDLLLLSRLRQRACPDVPLHVPRRIP